MCECDKDGPTKQKENNENSVTKKEKITKRKKIIQKKLTKKQPKTKIRKALLKFVLEHSGLIGNHERYDQGSNI